MKKILLISILLILSAGLFAQQSKKVHTLPTTSAGNYVQFDSRLSDTLKSADTISYVFPINHVSGVAPIIDLREKLVSTGKDTTVVLKVFESFDGITYSDVYAGTLGSTMAYTKTLAKAISQIQYDGIVDQVWFGTVYLKLMFVSPVRTGFKKILSGYVGFIQH